MQHFAQLVPGDHFMTAATSTTTNTRQIFERQVELIRGKLRQLAPDLMLELESTELALQNLSPDPNATEFAGYRYAIDAIDAYLDKHKHSAPGNVIASGVAAGGFLSKDKRAAKIVLDSIRYHLKHPETERLKAFSGNGFDPENAEVARFNWDDSFRRD
jgi:hypothetical protein